jgi:hypothetical protein
VAGDILPGIRPGKYRSVMENSTAHRAVTSHMRRGTLV